MKITVGADPELFIKDRDGNIVSGYGIIPGTKKEPHKVPHGAVQLDGMAAEFNIDPASTAEEFVHNIASVMRELKKFLPKGYSFDRTRCSYSFPVEYFEKQPEETKVLGCDPDFDAYTLNVNTPPSGLITQFRYGSTFRTVSGHIHIGWEGQSEAPKSVQMENAAAVARQMDFFLGVPLHEIDYPDTFKRRQLYGKPGAFRPKSYGVEYRTPTNAWLNSIKSIRLVFNNAILGFSRLLEDGDDLSDKYGNKASSIISSLTKTQISRSEYIDRVFKTKLEIPFL